MPTDDRVPPSAKSNSVALLLDESGGGTDLAEPRRIALGALRMRSWQVFPVPPRPDGFGAHDPYLLEIDYELTLEPGGPPLPWFEVSFGLRVAGDGEPEVVDAIPGCVLETQRPRTYALDSYLTFVPGDDIALSPTQPIVDVFGTGGPEVRWRYTAATDAGVRPGSYTAWASLVVPEGCSRLTVDVHARFDLDAGSAFARRYAPASEPTRLDLDLSGSGRFGGTLAPASGSAPAAPASVPRVFVCYAHDDPEHATAVLRFSEFLAGACGLDVHMDRWDLDHRRDWYLWAIDQIGRADFVLVIASPDCKAVADGRTENLAHRGLQSELSVIMDRLHTDRAAWRRKLLPVVLPHRTIDDIPLFLQPGIADHFLVSELTVEGAEDLLRVITEQPPYARPRRNSAVVRLPTRPAAF
ncbi:SEFIR domain-containing protein [Nocardia sp. NPDC004068]|uniref:SEFIR domain-containing protein n=1 Tax=Nocardia sp. NPDC004068 TaxID=3364303 RepID=UPI0036A907FE